MTAGIGGATIDTDSLREQLPIGASKIRESSAAIEFCEETEPTNYRESHLLGHAASPRFIHEDDLDASLVGKDDRARFSGSEAKLLAQLGHRAGIGYARDLDPRRLSGTGG